MREVLITKGAALGLAVMFFLLGGVAALNFFTIQRQIYQSQHQWCDTLNLLTSNGPPNKKLPKQQYQRGLIFYMHLKTLERQFHC